MACQRQQQIQTATIEADNQLRRQPIEATDSATEGAMEDDSDNASTSSAATETAVAEAAEDSLGLGQS